VSEELPHDLMIWVLIVSEMLVFGAGLWAFLAVRISDPFGFSEAAGHLHPITAGLGTMLLVTSGLFAAIGARYLTRWPLVLAGLGGAGFLWLKSHEWAALIGRGISTETHPFFTFYYLLTGFHAAHVIAGIAILIVVMLRRRAAEISAGVAFWHLVDLVWVAVFPVIYLMGGA
jgi:nitric oxide reductase NorE protein